MSREKSRSVLVALILAIPAWAVEGRITKLALNAGGTHPQTAGSATVFFPDAASIVCSWRAEGVTPGAHIRGVWIAEETGGAAPPNFKVDEASVVAATSAARYDGNGSFTISRPNKGWPLGQYRLEIYLEKELARTVTFRIQARFAADAPPARITQADLGTGRTEDFRLIDPRSEFPANTSQIVCAWKSQGVRPGVVIRGVWVAPDNAKLLESSKVADALFGGDERSGVFSIHRPPDGWAAGRYKLDIYLDNALARTVPFSILPNATGAAAAARITEAVLGTERTEDWQMVDPASEFPRGTKRVLCLWKSQGLKPGTLVRDVWIAEDLGPGHTPNTKIAEGSTTRSTRGSFALTSGSERGLRPGRYRLEIYFGDDLVRTVPFTVRDK